MAISPITTQLPVIPSEDFTKEKVLGQGGFGQVYLGSWQATPVAVKELLVQTISKTFLKMFQSEAELMAQCNHPNTVRLFGVCLEEGKLALIMEYLEKGSLYGMLSDTQVPIAWPRRFSIAADIGKGLAYLHNQKIIHRDLKSLNILLDENNKAKITDFGFAKIKIETQSHRTAHQQGGTARWTAPELFQPNTSANSASDVYSFGTVLWEIGAREVPFSKAANESIVIAWKLNNIHEVIPSDWPEEYAAIIQKCWKSPLERPPAKTIALELNQLQQNTKNIYPESPNLSETASYPSNLLDSIPKTPAQKAEPQKPILLAPSLKKAELPSIAFGKAEWAKYFGDVGIEPPLPADINAILSAPCPFWPNKKVQETHLLVLVPQTVNGKALTLKTLGELIQKPLQGTPTKYRYFFLGEYPDPAAPKAHWALITRDVIEGSRKKSYADQQALIKSKAPYEVPTILDATVAILMEHVRTGTRLYGDSPYTLTQCQEKYNKDWQLSVGGCSAAGLDVNLYGSFNVHVGVAGLRKFI